MSLDRRQVIAGGISWLAGGLVAKSGVLGGSPATPHRPRRPHPGFPGDPGAGRMYYGAGVMFSLSLPDLEAQLHGTLTARRSYYTADDVTGLVGRVQEDHAAGRFPLVSTKVPGTWADVATGSYDTWLTGLLSSLGATTQPVMLALHHEPEDDIGAPGMTAADWVLMQQRAISLATTLAPNTTIVPILMQWTFDPRSGRAPADWIVSEASILGLDVYNDWSPTDSLPWQTFADKVTMALPFLQSKPIAVAEYGCRTDPTQPGRAGTWMTDAFAFATQHNVMAMCYYDSSLNSPQGSWVLDQERTKAMRTCRHRANVARPH